MSSAITFGLSDKLIDATGLGKYGDKCSNASAAGQVSGAVLGIVSVAGTAKSLINARRAYVAAVRAIPSEARALGISTENAARWAVAARNVAKADARQSLGSLGKLFDARNEVKYGSELGKTANQLVGEKGTWDAVIDSAGKTSNFWNGLAGVP